MEYDDTKNHSFSSVAMSNTTVDNYDYPDEPMTLSELVALYAEDKTLNLILFIVTLLELITGTLGNLLVIAAVIVNKKLHKIHNVLVMNLAVADLCVSSFLNLTGIRNHGQNLLSNPTLCQFTGCLCTVSCVASVFSIDAIALNRYVRICHGRSYDVLFTKCTTIMYVLCTWGAAFAVDWIPYFFLIQGYDAHQLVPQVFFCMSRPSHLYGFVVPSLSMIIVIYCYLRVWLKVRSSKRNLLKFADGQRAIMTKTDYRLLRTLLILVLAFVILVVPFNIVYNASISVERETFIILFTMVHFNSCINCVIYALTNTEFRRGFVEVLRRCLQVSKPRKSSPVKGTVEIFTVRQTTHL
ncbi:melatonin receptor type 1A-A-like [Asterias rubens]|uniref:melatonin receptor type 1A-A-like n=1 Tax=Asterias rubens TaxID=7604 RepID=UPI001455A25B|nr:melatonin receptor type 1A-A-like [Asterias rubens]